MSLRGDERNARRPRLRAGPGARARAPRREANRARTGSGQPGQGLVPVNEGPSSDRSAAGRQVADRRGASGADRSSVACLPPGTGGHDATTPRRGAEEACGAQAPAGSSPCEEAGCEMDARRHPGARCVREFRAGRQAAGRRARALRPAPRRDGLPAAVSPVPRRTTRENLSAHEGRDPRRRAARRRGSRPSKRLTSVRRRRSGSWSGG
jgi:hypothetical protein